MVTRADIRNLIQTHERRLQVLREQRAAFGLHTQPHIVTEIEDIEAKIDRLRSQLEETDFSGSRPDDPGVGLGTQAVPRIGPTQVLTTFVGREDELDAGGSRVDEGRNTYLYGPYGVGKTCLTAELFSRSVEARTPRHGYLWHRVADATAEATVEAIASYFGTPRVAQAPALRDKINRLRELLSHHRGLLIGLDEVEDTRAGEAVLEAAGGCVVILNGVSPGLGDRAEAMRIRPLQLDEAEQLFATLAGLDLAHMGSQERRRIRQICRQMGRLPLAIKLAALVCAEGGDTPDELWERLQLAPTTVVPEHYEVSRVFETTYQRLRESPSALRMLVRIACFPALEAPSDALREGETGAGYFQAKTKLTALGLASPAGPERTAVHSLLGILSRERVATEDGDMVQREREWVADWLLAYGGANCDDYSALAREHDNLLGLYDWLKRAGALESLITLTGYLLDYLRVRGHWQEALERLREAGEAAEHLNRPCDKAWIRLSEGIIHKLRSEYDHAREALDEADGLYAAEDDLAGRGRVLLRRGMLTALAGELEQARRQLEQALEWMADGAPARDVAVAHEQLASVVAAMGNPIQARSHCQQALNLLGDRGGDREARARVHRVMGHLTRKAGDYPAARRHYAAAIELSAQLGYLRQTAVLKVEEGDFLYFQGEYADAGAAFEGALETFRELGYRLGEARALHGLGNIALAEGDLDLARTRYTDALAINRDLDNRAEMVSNQYQIGLVVQRLGELEQAERAYRDALREATELELTELQAACSHQLGRLALVRGDREEAGELAERAFHLAQAAELRLIELSALTLRGLIAAQQDHVALARVMLLEAYEAFDGLGAPEAAVAKRLLEELEAQVGADTVSMSDTPSAGIVMEGSGGIVWGDVISGASVVVSAEVDEVAAEMMGANLAELMDLDVVEGGAWIGIDEEEEPEG